MEEFQPCAVCKKDAEHRCAGCQKTYYCSREHQRQHWKNHRTTCRAYRIETHAIVGRHLIASRDIKPGDLIIQERPLAIGPRQFTRPVCLGCYSAIDGSYTCAKCGWPMCRAECCKKTDHAAECFLSSKHDQIRNATKTPNHDLNYQSVMVLRCLYLRDHDPSRWQELSQLQSHNQKRQDEGLEAIDRDVVVKFIHEHLKLADDFSEETILSVCGILFVNCFDIPWIGEGLQAVYATGSLLEHDCVPNANKTFNGDMQVVIRAAVAISKGDKIAITYTDPLWGTLNRQQHLKQSKFFTCQCERCKDPTELDTFMSAVNCQHCLQTMSSGFFICNNPLDESSDWTCNRCGESKPAQEINELIEMIGKQLISLKRGSVEACEHFLQQYHTVLHPHHFYILDVKLALCQMVGHEQGNNLIDFNEDMLSMKETICLELLKIIDVVCPGLTKLRGIVLYELQAVVAIRTRKLCITREISRDELKSHVKMVRKMLHDVTTIFSWEAQETDERQLAKIAAMELKDVDLFLNSLE